MNGNPGEQNLVVLNGSQIYCSSIVSLMVVANTLTPMLYLICIKH